METATKDINKRRKKIKMKISLWTSVFYLVSKDVLKAGENFLFSLGLFLIGENEFEKNGPFSLENDVKI